MIPAYIVDVQPIVFFQRNSHGSGTCAEIGVVDAWTWTEPKRKGSPISTSECPAGRISVSFAFYGLPNNIGVNTELKGEPTGMNSIGSLNGWTWEGLQYGLTSLLKTVEAGFAR